MDQGLRIIQYLGSKLRIVPKIKSELVKVLDENETVVDLFAGTGVVSYGLKDYYNIIANDIQEYSYLLSKVLLENNFRDISNKYTIDYLYQTKEYKSNYTQLSEMFKEQLEYEEKVLLDNDYKALSNLCESNIFYNNDNLDINKGKLDLDEVISKYENCFKYYSDEFIDTYKKHNNKSPYILFTLYYSNSYFGLKQAIEIDSLRYAIDKLSEKNYSRDPIKQLYLACLMHSLSEIVSSVGKHFAQPLKTINRNNVIKPFIIKRCLRDRKRNIKNYMESMHKELVSIANEKSHNNKVYKLDYNNLLDEIKEKKVGAFYVDPPYTIDHYSRFYHILETLVKYDYPNLEYKKFKGRFQVMNGRYRDDRFQSNFCIPSKGYEEFNNLIYRIKKFDAKLILSYSDHDEKKDTRKRVITREELTDILEKYYDNIKIINLEHSYRKLNEKKNNKEEKKDSELLFVCT